MANEKEMFIFGKAYMLDFSQTMPELKHKTAIVNEGTSLLSILELFLLLHDDEKYSDTLDVKIAKLLLDFAQINKN